MKKASKSTTKAESRKSKLDAALEHFAIEASTVFSTASEASLPCLVVAMADFLAVTLTYQSSIAEEINERLGDTADDTLDSLALDAVKLIALQTRKRIETAASLWHNIEAIVGSAGLDDSQRRIIGYAISKTLELGSIHGHAESRMRDWPLAAAEIDLLEHAANNKMNGQKSGVARQRRA